jgi:hypothetical protein
VLVLCQQVRSDAKPAVQRYKTGIWQSLVEPYYCAAPTIEASMYRLSLLFLLLGYGELRADCTEPGKARWPIKSAVVDNADLTHPTELDLQDLLDFLDPPGVTKNDSRYQNDVIPAFANSANLKEGDIAAVEGRLHLVAKKSQSRTKRIIRGRDPSISPSVL